ncbi:MAG: RNase adapter RapZ, partial [Pseudomonadota bacterium]
MTQTKITDGPQQITLVTGPAGGGRSTAINALEDLGFEAIDNLPLTLLPRLLDGRPLERPLALGIDTRNRDFSVPALLEAADALAGQGAYKTRLLYLDCRPEVLLRRYSETRRRHPFAQGDAPAEAVERELPLLAPVRERADILIDT